MAQPTGYTDVADGFDTRNTLDIDVRLGFRRSNSDGSIAREVVDSTSKNGRSTRHFVQVGTYETVRSELLAGLEVGLYRDLMLMLHMPIVLAEQRSLRPLSGMACGSGASTPGCAALLEAVPGTAGNTVLPLIALDQRLPSATRSGIPHIDLGIAWGVTNQFRTRHLPTWVLIVDTSINTGSVMRPCLDGMSGCKPGVSEGTARLGLESRWSYRFRHAEPFIGIGQDFTWVSGGGAVFEPAGPLPGVADAGPPWVTEATIGTALIPWEDRGRFQRFEFDVSATAALISAGRSFTPLFDALGTSANPYLTIPNYSRLSEPQQLVPFTGLTQTFAHARLGMSLEVVMQAARYVRFAIGMGLDHITPHLITGAAPCNTEAQLARGDSPAGNCAKGIVNPVYRPTIDAPGKRFLLDGELSWQLQGTATAQF